MFQNFRIVSYSMIFALVSVLILPVEGKAFISEPDVGARSEIKTPKDKEKGIKKLPNDKGIRSNIGIDRQPPATFATHPGQNRGNIGYEPAGQVIHKNKPGGAPIVVDDYTTPHFLKSKGKQVSESDPFAITGTLGEHGSADHAYDHHDQGLVSPADGHDPGTKTPTFQSK